MAFGTRCQNSSLHGLLKTIDADKRLMHACILSITPSYLCRLLHVVGACMQGNAHACISHNKLALFT